MQFNSIKFNSVTDIVICGGLTKYKSSLYFFDEHCIIIVVVVIYLRNENNIKLVSKCLLYVVYITHTIYGSTCK